jgi:hypothetical protein
MKIRIKETAVAGLGNPAVPGNYNTPDFGLGTAVSPGSPNLDAKLAAASAAATPNGIDPLNKGYQLGGAHDPLAEYEPATNNPPGMTIGGGTVPPPISTPGFPPMASSSFKEDETTGIDEAEDPFDESDPFAEDNPFAEDKLFGENGTDQVFMDADAIPAFEDIGDDPDLVALPVDEDGVIQPIVIPDDEIAVPELGPIPDVVLPQEEPILDITEDDVDVMIPEDAFENNGLPEAIPVVESFRLPENQSIGVLKGDQIFMLGHVREDLAPKFVESAFSRAIKSLAGTKGSFAFMFQKAGRKHEKVALVGRSLLVEVAKDWRLPGTDILFEAHDLLQIISAKPIREGEEVEDEKGKGGKSEDKDKAEKSKKQAEIDAEKAKKEYFLAKRRWLETKKTRAAEDDDDDDDISEDDPDKAEKKAKKERAKREAAFLERQKTGGWL